MILEMEKEQDERRECLLFVSQNRSNLILTTR
jgi:hypothetical protein